MISYSSAPLPFQGQKRKSVADFNDVLLRTRKPRIVDLFGGSGLLAHNAKYTRPDAEVVYNDFDNYSARLAKIAHTNEILETLRPVLEGEKRLARINEEKKAEVLAILEAADMEAEIDAITLSSSLMFSMNFAEDVSGFAGAALYSKIVKNPYNADGYLEGVRRVSMDYKALLAECDPRDTILIVDPPYLSTDASTYTDSKFWRISDYLDILTAIAPYDYFYFSADKSQIFELTAWIASNAGCYSDPFEGCEIRVANGVATKNATYSDLMFTNILI